MWHTQMAAVVGNGHRKSGLPCQDRTCQLERNGVTAIALADGAGSARLSHYGAEIAAQAACQVLCDRFDGLFQAASPLEMKLEVLQTVRRLIWEEAKKRKTAASDFACTLLAAAVRGDDYLIVHVGDGVIGYQKDRKLLVASGPQNGEFMNMTTFVTSQDVFQKTRVMRGRQPQLEGFVLMSDGCEAALYQKKRALLAPLVGRLLQRAELMSPDIAQELLEDVLADVVCSRTRDDCSLAVMTRSRGRFGAWERLNPRERAQILGIATEDRSRRRKAIRRYARLYGIV